LGHAVLAGSLEVVRTLVEEGKASVNIHDCYGGTLIELAITRLEGSRARNEHD
jgi:hypothetical protein